MENNTYLFFGGSYSNLHALQQLKSKAIELNIKPEHIYHSGDIVGYCAFPEESITFVREWNIQVIAGNVEVQLREGEGDCGCNFDEGSRCADLSTLWYPFAQTRIKKANIDWLDALPTVKTVEIATKKWAILHGGLEDISQFIFKSTDWKVKQAIFDKLEVDVIVAGHSGLPFIQQKNGKTWINPGVIGMPANDGTPRVWYGLFDALTDSFELKSMLYDAEKASESMKINNLPLPYAQTLLDGLWDNCEILPVEETKAQGIMIEESAVKL